MLTAAVRDLHINYPGQFLTDVRTSTPEIWEHNPYVTPLRDDDPEVETFECQFPLLAFANTRPVHYVQNFVEHFNQVLDLKIVLTAFRGDVHLSSEEKSWTSHIEEMCGTKVPYWVLVAGGKRDVTVKWWETRRFQEVIDNFRGRIVFVRVGLKEHFHPDLDGVIDLRGKTSIRQLIRLIYHSQGVLCPVTFAMHLAAAVEVKPDGPKHRPCVVIAGGREPVNWEAYPHHQFLHTVGSLLCCDNGGCWKSRVRPLGDGDERDQPQNLCVNVVDTLPKCMDLISVHRVKSAVAGYFDGGTCSFLNSKQWAAVRRTLKLGEQTRWDLDELEARSFRMAADEFISTLKEHDGEPPVVGRGIVICAGGEKYLASAWVCVRMLRAVGCELPIEIWHLGPAEMPAKMREAFARQRAIARDALETKASREVRRLGGWELKPFAILNSSFQEVLLLDADNVPVADPTWLFDCPEFRQHGAVFWPDIRLGLPRSVWRLFDVRFRDEPEFESGQILVDKVRNWRPLRLTMWFNEHSDFYYRHILGDKDTFHMAFHKLSYSFHFVKHLPVNLTYALRQHDPHGKPLFLHRNGDKWSVHVPAIKVKGFINEALCIRFLNDLRRLLMRSAKKTGGKGAVVIPPEEPPLTESSARPELERAIAKLSNRLPFQFRGRGIVLCGGGHRYLPGAFVLVKMLRQHGSTLPIELWYLGDDEMPSEFFPVFKKLGVNLINAHNLRRQYPVRRLFGWELKPYALMYSSFREVLLLDADNVPIKDPAFLFESADYVKTGALFWPDLGRLKPDRSIWRLTGVEYQDEPEFETGQIVIDKERCWKALQLTMWFNEHSDFFYRHIHGDKETFHFAFRKLRQPFAMPPTPVRTLDFTLCQHDFSGNILFQHRNGDKWRLDGQNKTIPGFRFEKRCLKFISLLRTKVGLTPLMRKAFTAKGKSERLLRIAEELTTAEYQYIRIGHDRRPMTLATSGSISVGAGACEQSWDIKEEKCHIILSIYSDSHETCRLMRKRRGYWEGRWLRFEKMPVQLIAGNRVRSRPSLGKPRDFDPTRRIYFRTPLTGFTGYGLHATQIVSDFHHFGYEFDIRVVHMNERFATVPEAVKACIVSEEGRPKWELLLHPPGFTPLLDRKTVYFTMWESTRLPGHAVQGLNRADLIIVPCQWNASVFSAAGVERPIHVVQLGIKTDIFEYREMNRNAPCVFLTGGRLESGGTRKSIDSVMRLFKKAFPREKDVALEVKVFPDCSVPAVTDPRIKIHRKYFSETELAAWFARGTCFISCARAEGWGLMQQQALAVGRPVISIGFGGVAEFLTAEAAYIVDHTLKPSSGIYAGFGLWAEPNEAQIIDAMRQVYHDRSQAAEKGKKGALHVKQFSWQRSSTRIRDLLVREGFLESAL